MQQAQAAVTMPSYWNLMGLEVCIEKSQLKWPKWFMKEKTKDGWLLMVFNYRVVISY